MKICCYNCKHRKGLEAKPPCKALLKGVLEWVKLPVTESNLKKIGLSCGMFELREDLKEEKVGFT